MDVFPAPEPVEATVADGATVRDQTVLDFWYPRSIDEEYGGSLLEYDADGEHIGDDRYRAVFEETWAFLDEYGIDRAVGEWHSRVTDDGQPVGRKGAVHKGAYQHGRALRECLEALDRLGDA